MDNYGGKADSLLKLRELGYRVPEFIVVGGDTPEILEEIKKFIAMFSSGQYYAVRSSANMEDGNEHSFAGIFESYLYVEPKDILAKIELVLDSVNAPRVLKYMEHHNIDHSQLKMSVIIQVMIEAEVSGVGFSKDPLRPYLDRQVVNSVYGLGEGLVSGTLNADNYIRDKAGVWKSNVAEKETRLIFRNNKLKYESLPDVLKTTASLRVVDLDRLTPILQQLERDFNAPQDVEFCIKDETIYILQSRPITGLDKTHIIWDNSNIVESYPGITSPFTFSFIKRIYETVYYNFGKMLGVPVSMLEKNRGVFAEMLGHINGRVYYHLKNWYKALAMLPAYKINAPYMEKMMGVSESIEVELEGESTSRIVAYWRMIKVCINLIKVNKSLPQSKKAFTEKVSHVVKGYREKDYTDLSVSEVWEDYNRFKDILINEWTPPLANDLLAMIYYGVLSKFCESWLGSPGLQNRLVVGRYPVKSVQPALLIRKIIDTAHQEGVLQDLQEKSAQDVWMLVQEDKFKHTGQLIAEYIKQYGDRAVGELKLENITYTQDPLAFVKVLQSYKSNPSDFVPHDRTINGEPTVSLISSLPWFKRKVFNYVSKKAAETIADRENLRFDRTFAFGIIRKFIRLIGYKWEHSGLLLDKEDIFYLEEQDIDQIIKGVQLDPKEMVRGRQEKFREYQRIKSLPMRIHQFGEHLDIAEAKDDNVPSDLSGIPCSPGEVVGKVRVLNKADEVKSIDGDILVTISTDPGWITIFQSASAILVERGSILSHAAIVSREMGIPCIVGVKGVTTQLKSGDMIKMNGSTGKIEKL